MLESCFLNPRFFFLNFSSVWWCIYSSSFLRKMQGDEGDIRCLQILNLSKDLWHKQLLSNLFLPCRLLFQLSQPRKIKLSVMKILVKFPFCYCLLFLLVFMSLCILYFFTAISGGNRDKQICSFYHI